MKQKQIDYRFWLCYFGRCVQGHVYIKADKIDDSSFPPVFSSGLYGFNAMVFVRTNKTDDVMARIQMISKVSAPSYKMGK